MNNSSFKKSDLTQEAALEVYENRLVGFWFFLMTDVIIFSLLFATYIVMQNKGLPHSAQGLFDLRLTALETFVLLTSTLTFSFVTVESEEKNKRRVLGWLSSSLLLGLLFLSLELYEFHQLIQAGHGPQESGFLSSFFILVGTHGLHVLIGVLMGSVMTYRIIKRDLTPLAQSQLQRLGLYWHFLDIIWIGIFTVVYLPGVL